MNLTTATPVEIDTRLAEIYAEQSRLATQRTQAEDTVERIEGVQGSYEAEYPWNSPEKLAEAEATIVRVWDRQKTLIEEARPLEARYTEERWTRYYWVTNTGGHIHSSMSCETCFPTTGYAWMTEYSGMSHDDLVDLAGEVACTVCFPNAPVDVLKRKTRMELPERKARRLEREAKAAAKAAAEVTVEGFYDWSQIRTKTFKSERAATNAIAEALSSLCWYGESHPSAQGWISNIAKIREALEAKGVEYDYDKALAAARKKTQRDGCTPKF